jgi:hypothetical protein
MFSDYGLVSRTGEDGSRWLAVHRVFYTLKEEPYAVSAHPCSVHFGDAEEGAEILNFLAEASANGDILDYDSLPKIEGEYGEGVIDFLPSDTIPEQNAQGSFSLN